MTVDPTNPGQFFACCGLLELADRLWPGAEGWFEGREFCIRGGGTLSELLAALASATIVSTLTDQEIDRLGTLLSANKAKLTRADTEEKLRLISKWKCERLHLSKPLDMRVDWWSDEDKGGKVMKTWAAKQFVLKIVRPLQRAMQKQYVSGEAIAADVLTRTAPVESVPFYFDAHCNWQSTPRDTGFGLYTLRNVIRTQDITRPLLELAAFLGIQRFRPAIVSKDKIMRYSLWPIPLPVSAAGVATTGLLELPGEQRFVFKMLFRSEYMKAFLPAEPYRGT